MAAALAADAVIPVDAVDLAVVPAAGSGSSFFCAAVVETATDSWETTAVDVAADNHFLLAGGSFPLPLYILQDYNFVLIIHAT